MFYLQFSQNYIKIHQFFFQQFLKINQQIYCDSTNIIYLITCNLCHIQYVGETDRTLRQRMGAHRSCVNSSKYSQNRDMFKHTPISIHFNSHNHKLSHILVTPIEMITVNDPSTRKSREAYWQQSQIFPNLNTIFPDGLNNLPTRPCSIFKNLNIIQPLDLADFWNLYSLSILSSSP